MSRFKFIQVELRRLGMVIRRESGEYRVNVKGASEATAYYTNDLDDALGTGRIMAARQREIEAEDHFAY